MCLCVLFRIYCDACWCVVVVCLRVCGCAVFVYVFCALCVSVLSGVLRSGCCGIVSECV